ncbi:hypothetical protein FSP39_023279 [Pinctada imbricata]|uniref:Aminopeptidase NAALADL1 n=1 Tax=Pinctada imbricata TaxID=66713 RepID=A0AA88XY89_PINIB|nr:hypothetical protein FSP39_023279 [Pinctada imbricata]
MQSTENFFIRRGNKNRARLIVIAIFVLIISFLGGILIGKLAICDEKKCETITPVINDASIKEADPHISNEIISGINSENIRQYLRDLTELPHLAGTDADYRQAKELTDFWKAEGLDETFLTPYDILLSYPNNEDEDKMNRLFIYDDSNTTVWQSELREPILHPSENKSNVVPPFNAFSAPGDISSDELIYVNYGRDEDFKWLLQNRSVSVENKIVLARYGKIFRGDKVYQAERYKAKGIIIYSDPADYDDGDTSHVYPDDWWLPDTGVQRGTVYRGKGDPLTQGYPSTDTAFRLSQDDPSLPLAKIPVHPIGYGVAAKLIRRLRMRISTKNKRRTTYNAFGIIRGAVEPDRYVLLGNHRDAWVFGATDPSSGTAIMKEISRVMGNMVKSGRWRPRRSIIFCSWGAEEYGLLGSTEWIEATPLMYATALSATKKVRNPDPADVSAGIATVYDKWFKSFPNDQNSRPKIGSMGSGSDYASFIQQVGLPCLDFSYTYDETKYPIPSYPLYHSKYETFYSVDALIDRGFHVHKAVGQTWAEAARNLADAMIIPFDVKDYANELDSLVNILLDEYGELMQNNGINLDHIRSAAANFSNTVTAFVTSIKNEDKNDPYAIRRINDQLMQLDRAFIDPNGLPNRPLVRHLLFADSSLNAYAGSSFPGLVDSLFEIDKAVDKEASWNIVKKHYSAIVFAIGAASSSLRDTSSFMNKNELHQTNIV